MHHTAHLHAIRISAMLLRARAEDRAAARVDVAHLLRAVVDRGIGTFCGFSFALPAKPGPAFRADRRSVVRRSTVAGATRGQPYSGGNRGGAGSRYVAGAEGRAS